MIRGSVKINLLFSHTILISLIVLLIFVGGCSTVKQEKLCLDLLNQRAQMSEIKTPDAMDEPVCRRLEEQRKQTIALELKGGFLIDYWSKYFDKCFISDLSELNLRHKDSSQIELSIVYSDEAVEELASSGYSGRRKLRNVAKAFSNNLNKSFKFHDIPARIKLNEIAQISIDASNYRSFDQCTKKEEFKYSSLMSDIKGRHNGLESIARFQKTTSSDIVIVMVGSKQENHSGECGRDFPAILIDNNFKIVNPFQAIAIVNLKCVCSQESLAHEIGHLIGAHHDIEPHHKHKYRRGFQNPETNWASIMSVSKKTCPTCKRENYWSDSSKTHPDRALETPIGTHENDVAKHWKRVASCAASFDTFREEACNLPESERGKFGKLCIKPDILSPIP